MLMNEWATKLRNSYDTCPLRGIKTACRKNLQSAQTFLIIIGKEGRNCRLYCFQQP